MSKTVTGARGLRRLAHSDLRFGICLVIGTWSLGLLLAVGCSSGPVKGDVKGKVTFKGNPVKEGKVTFLNPAGLGDSEADISGDGTYEVRGGVVVGEYIVEIKPLVVIVDTDPGKSPPAPVEKKAPDIPGKYRQQGSTPFKNVAVKGGKNEINFEMTP
jgi:hypothetical protein